MPDTIPDAALSAAIYRALAVDASNVTDGISVDDRRREIIALTVGGMTLAAIKTEAKRRGYAVSGRKPIAAASLTGFILADLETMSPADGDAPEPAADESEREEHPETAPAATGPQPETPAQPERPADGSVTELSRADKQALGTALLAAVGAQVEDGWFGPDNDPIRHLDRDAALQQVVNWLAYVPGTWDGRLPKPTVGNRK